MGIECTPIDVNGKNIINHQIPCGNKKNPTTTFGSIPYGKRLFCPNLGTRK